MNRADRMELHDLPMPDLASSFPGPFPTSPHADHVEQQALRWLGEFPLLAPSDALRTLCNITGQGVARTFPTAGQDSLVLCAQLFLWLTAFDDVHGEAAAARDPALLVDHVGELTLVLADGDVPAAPGPFAAALQDLLARFRAVATPAQYLRLTGHLRDNLFGIVWEAHHLIAPEQVTVREYCAMRPYTVFVRTIMATAEIVLGYELSDEQRSSAPVRQLEAAVANLAGWINDLVSYRREATRMGMNPLSLPTLLMAEHGLDLRKAVQAASRMCEKQAAIARSRINELTPGPTSTLAVHARAMENIAHSFVWHTAHARYR
ncbi:terpene synthase family protein [Streptomyces sp. NPDC002519]